MSRWTRIELEIGDRGSGNRCHPERAERAEGSIRCHSFGTCIDSSTSLGMTDLSALHNERKFIRNFVNFGEIMLDKWLNGWYHNRARVGTFCACTAMMQEIASKNGNFCGVCPVIGRLNCFCSRWRISLGQKKGSALRRPFFLARNDTHGGVNREVRPYPDIKQTEYEILGGNKPWQTRK